jgi:hypothetical protein
MKIVDFKEYKKKYHFFFIFILIFITLPTVVLFGYNHPVNDDLCIAVEYREFGFLGEITNYYFNWGGRVIALIHLSFIDFLISNLTWFRICGFLFLLIHFYSVFYFIKTIFSKIELKLSFTFFVFFIIVELLYLPSPQQGFFWFTGMVAYILPFSYLLFSISSFIRYSESKNKKYFFLTLIFAFLSAGSHELISLIYILILLLSKLDDYLKRENKLRISKIEIYLFIILISIFVLIFLAPGNTKREITIADNNNLIASILNSFKILFLNIIKWLQNGVFLAIALLFISEISRQKYFLAGLKIKKTGLMFFGFLCILFVTILAPLHFGGEIPNRVLNITFLLFIFLFFISIWFIVSHVNSKFKVGELNFIYKFLIMIFLIFQLKDGNIRIAYIDLLSGDAKKYSKEWDIRVMNSKMNKNNEVEFKKISICPQSICGDDLKSDKSNWKNKCFSSYYLIKSVEIMNGLKE